MKQLYFLLGALLLTSLHGNAQQQLASVASYRPDRGGHTINSNVSLNEISVHAYRHFQKLFPTVSGEYWLKTSEGYIVSFALNSFLQRAHFNLRGNFLCSEKYYGEKDLPLNTWMEIKKKYPDYRIDVVTEITTENGIFYLLKIECYSSVKTISFIDGKIEVMEDLANGG